MFQENEIKTNANGKRRTGRTNKRKNYTNDWKKIYKRLLQTGLKTGFIPDFRQNR